MKWRWLGLAGPVAKALQPAGCLISHHGKLTVSMFAFVGLTDNRAQDETCMGHMQSPPCPKVCRRLRVFMFAFADLIGDRALGKTAAVAEYEFTCSHPSVGKIGQRRAHFGQQLGLVGLQSAS